jgi:hypothetical protein
MEAMAVPLLLDSAEVDTPVALNRVHFVRLVCTIGGAARNGGGLQIQRIYTAEFDGFLRQPEEMARAPDVAVGALI